MTTEQQKNYVLLAQLIADSDVVSEEDRKAARAWLFALSEPPVLRTVRSHRKVALINGLALAALLLFGLLWSLYIGV
jgi:hypothetical protein